MVAHDSSSSILLHVLYADFVPFLPSSEFEQPREVEKKMSLILHTPISIRSS